MPRSNLAFHDVAPAEESFEAAVREGLSQRPKAIPCKFLYDARGSALFDEICLLPEYYPTRAEVAILCQKAPEIARLLGPRVQLLEFGSGSSRKIRLLLDLLSEPSGYVPIDISGDHLRRAAKRVALAHPHIPVTAVCADYTAPFDLPRHLRGGFDRRVVFFPGSTICNLTPETAIGLMRRIRVLVGRGGGLLIGVDMKKDEARLNAAYNDASGVTAAFNLNLLGRINRDLGGDFDLSRFSHEAFYNVSLGRIEIYIRSEFDQFVQVSGRRYRFAAGERVHTEYSYKYDVDEFRALAAKGGFRAVETWLDEDRLFSVHYLSGR